MLDGLPVGRGTFPQRRIQTHRKGIRRAAKRADRSGTGELREAISLDAVERSEQFERRSGAPPRGSKPEDGSHSASEHRLMFDGEGETPPCSGLECACVRLPSLPRILLLKPACSEGRGSFNQSILYSSGSQMGVHLWSTLEYCRG